MKTRHLIGCHHEWIAHMVRLKLIALLVLLLITPTLPAAKTAKAHKWTSAFDEFDKSDRAKLPPTGAIVFVGSSSIRLWDLEKSFPGVATINRGFGGSEAADSAKYAERLVIKYQPRLVVFYAGDNDIAHGKSPETVRDDVEAFVTKVRKALPETKILLLSVKPSQSRANFRDKQEKANELVQQLTADDKNIKFIDVGKVLLDADGKPRSDLFLKDQLHLNDEGYRLWTQLLKPHLE